jgi:hypothetical protein
MKLVSVFLLAFLVAGLALAEEGKTLLVTVTGGERDLANVVVRVPLAGQALAGFDKVRVQEGPKGPALLGQVTSARLLSEPAGKGEAPRELTFILPQLKAGETKTLTVLTSYSQNGTPKPFHWQDTPGDHAELIWGSATLLRYMYAPLDESSKEKREETFKVYHHLWDWTGQTLITKGPGGLYTHHRGIFFGFNRISYDGHKDVDVWHCKGDAHQSHEGFVQQVGGEVLGRHRVKVAWHGEKKQIFAEEQRELTVYRPFDNGLLVEFATVLRPSVAKVRLDGDPQHSGFHLRLSNEVADQVKEKMPQTYFVRPDGKGKIGEERNWDPKTKKGPVNLPWDGMSFVLGGKRYTALYLDRPDNPKESRGSERIYGRVGNYFEYDLTEEKPLRLNYRIWLQEGELTPEQCEAISRAFVEPIKVAVK